MAEPLKNQFGVSVVERLASQIAAAYPEFDMDAFVTDALNGFEALPLMLRGRKIAQALRRTLPDNYPEAIRILMASIGLKSTLPAGSAMASFFYLPHTIFVAEFGLDHFEISMNAQYVLTQRFTAEFSIRPFLERHPDRTLSQLHIWTQDPSVHVRRLVSEGTRPRLPWAPRLRQFQEDPGPVLTLLESLKDDPELYVRRSVANNLNDMGKDHPALLVATAQRWLVDASDNRRRLVRHALRSAIKQADPGALHTLGFGEVAQVKIDHTSITPSSPTRGESVTITFEITNTEPAQQRVLVDCRIHFIKANGASSPKVFKLKAVQLGPLESMTMSKTISLAELTTRKHYVGLHRVDVMVNGATQELGSFTLRHADTGAIGH